MGHRGVRHCEGGVTANVSVRDCGPGGVCQCSVSAGDI